MKIYEYAQTWLEEHRAAVRRSTYENYGYALKRFKRFFPNCELSELTRGDVADTLSKMCDQGLSRSSISNVCKVLSPIYRSAIRQHLTDVNPFDDVAIPAEASTKHVDAYTEEEFNRLIKAANDDPIGDSFIFMIISGLRLNEMTHLRWEDYDPCRHTISIRQSKTASGVSTIAVSDIGEIILHKQPVYDHGYIFSNLHKNPLTTSSMRKLLYRLRNKSGVTDATHHRCRHTFCTLLIERGADPKTVSTVARHSSVAFTMQRYVTCNIGMQRRALSLLDDVFISSKGKSI